MKKDIKYITDIGFAGLADFLRLGGTFFLIPILTKILGPEEYGIWSLIKTTLVILTPIVVLGLDTAVMRFIPGAQKKELIREGFISSEVAIIFFSFVVSAACFFLSKPLSLFLLGSEKWEYCVRLLAALLFVFSIDRMGLVFLRSVGRIKLHSALMTIGSLFEIGMVIYVVLSGAGIVGALIAILAVKLLFALITHGFIYISIGVSRIKFAVIKQYARFGFPIVVAMFFYMLVNYADRYLINYFLDAAQVGIYSVGYAVGSLVIIATTPFEYVLYPKLVSYWNNNELSRMKTYAKKTLMVSMAMGAAMCLFITVFSKKIIIIVSTQAFEAAAPVIPYIGFGFFIFGIGIIGERIITLLNKTRLIMHIYGLLAVINILLNIILIPKIGIQGAALATFITFFLYSVIMLSISYKYIL